MNIIFIIALTLFILSLPYWLPTWIIRLRMHIFTWINGEQAIQVPNENFNASDFQELYAHPAMKGRSKGAALSDLFWYWLSPGPEMHPEHLELSKRYQTLSSFSRKIMAISRTEIEILMEKYKSDPLQINVSEKNKWVSVRLRDAFMPLWADFFYRVVFQEECDEQVNKLIVNHANDVVNALKCVKLRDMKKRNELTQYLYNRIEHNELPHSFPKGFTTLEKAHYLQGTFFNTAVVQMSEAMTHLVLAISQHQNIQTQLQKNLDQQLIDDVINESLRLHPLFGIAHRITTDEVEFKGKTIPKNTVVCFNYPNYHQMGYSNPEEFNPERWKQCPVKKSNFMPFGSPANRSCPAQGLAVVTMRQLTRHLFSNYSFISPTTHTRSLPNGGPCLIANIHAEKPINSFVFPLMKFKERWEDLIRSVMQLFYGTVMILHARKLKLCENYFKLSKPADL